MANRYLITGGGSVVWDASDTAIWSDTSGGTTGQSVPVDGDAVIMDGSSGGGTVTLGYSPTVTSITMGDFTGTFAASTFSPVMNTFSASGAGVRTLSMGSGTWTLRGNNTTIWTTATTTNLTMDFGTSTINCTYSGSTGTRTLTTGASAALGVNHVTISAGSDTVALTTTFFCADLDFTGFSGIWGNTSATVSGNYKLSPTMTVTSGSTLTMTAASGTKTMTTGGVQMNKNVTINAATGATVQLLDSLNMAGASARTLTHTQGTFDWNNFNITCGVFNTSNANVRSLLMGNGRLTLTFTGTVWTAATTTNLTITPGNSTIALTDASATNKTFSGGGMTYGNLYLTGAGTGVFIIIGSNTFNNLTMDTPPHTLQFTAGTTTTVSSWNVQGSGAGNMTITSVTAATHTITKANPGVITSGYLSLTNSIAAGTGATWYAGATPPSVDNGGNTGWVFTANPVLPGNGGGGNGKSFGRLASLGSLARL